MRKGVVEYAPVPMERTTKTGIPHLNGAISMVRTVTDTAANQFFILKPAVGTALGGPSS